MTVRRTAARTAALLAVPLALTVLGASPPPGRTAR